MIPLHTEMNLPERSKNEAGATSEAGNIKKIDVETLKKFADALGVLPENITEWDKDDYKKYREEKQGQQEAKIIKLYSQLTHGHKKAVRTLMENLLECQEKNSSSK